MVALWLIGYEDEPERSAEPPGGDYPKEFVVDYVRGLRPAA
jgi:hypothetical protein